MLKCAMSKKKLRIDVSNAGGETATTIMNYLLGKTISGFSQNENETLRVHFNDGTVAGFNLDIDVDNSAIVLRMERHP